IHQNDRDYLLNNSTPVDTDSRLEWFEAYPSQPRYFLFDMMVEVPTHHKMVETVVCPSSRCLGRDMRDHLRFITIDLLEGQDLPNPFSSMMVLLTKVRYMESPYGCTKQVSQAIERLDMYSIPHRQCPLANQSRNQSQTLLQFPFESQ